MMDKALSDLISRGTHYDVEFKIKRKVDGKIIDLRSVAEIDATKNIVFGTVQDISEQKHLEETLRLNEHFMITIMDNIPGMVGYWDSELRNTFANSSYLSFFGKTKEQMKGITMMELMKPELFTLNEPYVKNALAGNKQSFERTLIKQDGTTSYTWAQYIPDIENKKVKGFFVIVTDITKIKSAQLELQELNEKLQLRSAEIESVNNKLTNLNADKDRFMSILAHDLKSPFNLLLGFSALLLENIHEYDIDKIKKQLTFINSSAQNIYTLLDNLLMWAHAQAGHLQFRPQDCNFAKTIADIIEVLSPTANEKKISINQSGTIDITVYADVDMLKTVLRNLISNAIKFSNSEGKIDITVSKSSSEIMISVSDNGVGMKPETLSKLFDFAQIHTSPGTSGEKGTGLGLLLCKEFVENHGGRIWAESELKHGSTFRFTLPCKL